MSEEEKNSILKMLEGLSEELKVFKEKQTKRLQKKGLEKLDEDAEIVNHYRRFVSPRKLTGKLVNKAKEKFYYETEHFVGGIVERQQKFNKETVKYLASLEKQIKEIKEKLDS